MHNFVEVYEPEQPGENRQLVIFAHGGSWVKEDPAREKAVAKYFTARGMVVACCRYRLYPEVSYPDNAKDVAQAIEWCYDNANTLKVNYDFCGMGHSAGGHLMSMVVLSSLFGRAGDYIKRLVNFSAVFDICNLPKFEQKPFEGQDCKICSPITYVSNKIPLFVGWGTLDFPRIKTMGKIFIEKAKAAGGIVKNMVVPGIHRQTAYPGKYGQELLNFILKGN